MNNLPIETYESVVQQRDALEKKLADMAAENTAMKSIIQSVKAMAFSNRRNAHNCGPFQMTDLCGDLIAECSVVTTSSDAFTREWMARGVESGAEHFRSRARCADGLGHHDRACFLDTTAEMFDEYAESLRKGINDAQ